MRSKQVYEINSAKAHNHFSEDLVLRSFVRSFCERHLSVTRLDREVTKTAIDCNRPGRVDRRKPNRSRLHHRTRFP